LPDFKIKLTAWWLILIIPATREAEIRRVEDRLGKKYSEIPSQPVNWAWQCESLIPASWKITDKRIRV
jgi:hypothetical protein